MCNGGLQQFFHSLFECDQDPVTLCDSFRILQYFHRTLLNQPIKYDKYLLELNNYSLKNYQNFISLRKKLSHRMSWTRFLCIPHLLGLKLVSRWDGVLKQNRQLKMCSIWLMEKICHQICRLLLSKLPNAKLSKNIPRD